MPQMAYKTPSITITPRTHKTSKGRFFNKPSGSKYPISKMIAKNKANNGIIDSSFNSSFNVSIHVFFFISSPVLHILITVLFYRQFRLCITKASGKAHTPMFARIQRLSLWESSRRSRVRGCFNLSSIPLRRLRRHLSQRERLFVSSIITQIGRENKFSAENYVSRTVEDAGPYIFVNILMRTLLNEAAFAMKTGRDRGRSLPEGNFTSSPRRPSQRA